MGALQEREKARPVIELGTVLSSPSMIIITKKMMAKKVEPIMFAMASG